MATSLRLLVVFALAAVACVSSVQPASAQKLPSSEGPSALRRLSLDELINLEVTTVSRQAERPSESASAIQVITGEDIRRSGATSLAEALRLVPSLRVSQVNSYGWVVSSRGFGGLFANKLLVMIDGRSVYTPLFAGVAWDVQNPPLEDIERIEVVAGPGGTLWGSNAVNGVINIISKSANDTRGIYASGSGGSFLNSSGSVRYGGAVGSKLAVRTYAQRMDRDPTLAANGREATDAWTIAQAGFRADWQYSPADSLTIQGDVYGGRVKTSPAASLVDGQNVLGRWTHTISSSSDYQLQLYVDRTWRRDVPSTVSDELVTTDVDFQHRFPAGERHGIIWGAGYRFMRDDTPTSTPIVGFVPQQRDMRLFNAFAQDEIALIPARLKLTVGTKVEHNVFSGLEVQPSARVAWIPTPRHTVWSAVSRAVRTPSRIDVDYHIPAMVIPIGTPGVNGGPDFVSEKVITQEIGYHLQPTSILTLSAAGFYNVYDDLYSVESVRGTPTYQIQNGTEGESWGVELTGTFQPVARWRVRGGYTFFQKELRNKPGRIYDFRALGNDPAHQVLLQSMIDLPGNGQLDMIPRYVSRLPSPSLPGYASLDLRAAWLTGPLEIAFVAQNLGDTSRLEFGDQLIRRSTYVKITLRR